MACLSIDLSFLVLPNIILIRNMLYDYWQSQCFWLCALIRFKPYWRRSRTQKLTSLISSNTVVHSIWKRGCCGFRFNEVSRSITRFLECPHARFLINTWNVDSDEAIRNVLIIFFSFSILVLQWGSWTFWGLRSLLWEGPICQLLLNHLPVRAIHL